MKSELVYLDVCALCRPFDDQRYVRIRLESEAVHLILETVRFKRLRLVVSPVHHEEINGISDPVERHNLLALLNTYGEKIAIDIKQARGRAETFFSGGFGVADAAHVAFSEAIGSDFISCDDRLLKKCIKSDLKIWCGDPLQYCIKKGLK
jgi:hypothetical protein